MKNIKLIFIDLDGTTIDSIKNGKKRISLKNRKLVDEARQKGIKVVVSTGRKPDGHTKVLLKDIGSESDFLAWNGSYVVQNGIVIKNESINSDLVKKIIKLVEKTNLSFIINSDIKNNCFTNNKFLKFILSFSKIKAKKYSEFIFEKPISKMMIWDFSPRKIKKFYENIKNEFSNDLEIVFTGKRNNMIEITSKNCTKGDSEILFCSNLGIKPEECAHIGDTENDMSGNKLGVLISMKNGSKRFKKTADVISKYNYKNAGLGKTIKKYILKCK
ncbi:COF family HAD hydrolase protein [Mycoplasmopsis maculosa]|uniref:COF family HAD hydrolase protein n=1 Tax=Mycoplasmopsis maculosa TaxID=114885 RepID=A0A449B4G9_9BACT|nr:HAD family hydrolase [Mycoplasmopsis maculosa]VEU75428.1 COF family HAD hydrolase protein [Mycoplasmopsis maculosa]